MGSRCGEETILHHMFHRCVRLNYLGALTVMINLVADGILISHFLGGQAAAAFGLVMPVYSLLNLFPCLLRTSAQAKLGAHIGRGDVDGAGQCVFYLLASGIAAAISLGLLLSLFRGTMIAVLCARADYDEQTVLWASEYLLCFAPAVFPLMLCAVLHPLVQIDGDEERSPRAIQIATTINLLGDLVNVLLFHGGMAGMAVATTLSCYGELLVLLTHFCRPETAVRLSAGGAFSAEKLFQLSAGIPLMLREFCTFLSAIFLNRLASGINGEDGVAVLAIAGSLWIFLLPWAITVSRACMTMGSISSGEADSHAVHRVSALGRWYAFVPGTAYAALFILLSGPLALFCTGGDDRLLGLLLPYLRCMALTLPFVCYCQTVEAMLIVRFRDTGRRFDPTKYIRQFRAAPQDPARNVGLRIVSGTAEEMRYFALLDCNIVILRFAGRP